MFEKLCKSSLCYSCILPLWHETPLLVRVPWKVSNKQRKTKDTFNMYAAYAPIHSLWWSFANTTLLHASRALFRTSQSWHLYASIQPAQSRLQRLELGSHWMSKPIYWTPAFRSNWFDIEDVNPNIPKLSTSGNIEHQKNLSSLEQ